VLLVEDGLADAERGEGDGGACDQRDQADDGRLGGQEGAPVWHRREAGSDEPGRVLRGDGEYAEDADRELSQQQPGKALAPNVPRGTTPRA
jgi:hypothetical protein